MTTTEKPRVVVEVGDTLEILEPMLHHLPPANCKVIRVNLRDVLVEFKNGDQLIVTNKQARIVAYHKGARS